MTTNPLHDYEAHIADNLGRILGERPNLNANKIATAMSDRGVPMDAKAVSRIIAHERRIKFNEAACLVSVLGLGGMDEITVPPAVARSKQLLEPLKEWRAADSAAEQAIRRRDEAAETLRNAAKGEGGTQALVDAITRWNERRLEGKVNRIMTTDFWMHRLTGEDGYLEAWREHLSGLALVVPSLDGDPNLPLSEHPDAQDG